MYNSLASPAMTPYETVFQRSEVNRTKLNRRHLCMCAKQLENDLRVLIPFAIVDFVRSEFDPGRAKAKPRPSSSSEGKC